MKTNALSYVNLFNNAISALLKRPAVLILFTLVLHGLLPASVQAGGGIMITPTRVVFEGRDRTARVTIINQDSETGNFRISFVRQNMTEEGEFVKVGKDEAGMFSDEMIRYSPRQITLPPGGSQVVRLMLRKSRNLEDGEYRSHMLFQSLPKPSARSVEDAVSTEKKGIKIEIIPIIGVSIPVIVRHGNLDTKLSISDLKILPADKRNPNDRVSMNLHREGKSSAYGDLRAIFTSKTNNSEPVVLGQANGVAVYANVNSRKYALQLQKPPGFSLSGGELRVTYIESGKDEKTGLIAESKLTF